MYQAKACANAHAYSSADICNFLYFFLVPFFFLFTTGKKGQYVWTNGKDAEALSRGVYNTYTKKNLRYSQV